MAIAAPSIAALAKERVPPIVAALQKGDQAALTKILAKKRIEDLFARTPADGAEPGLGVFALAAKRGDLESLRALMDAADALGMKVPQDAFELVAARGPLEAVDLFVERRVKRRDLALFAAAKAGRVEVLERLLAAPPDPEAHVSERLDGSSSVPHRALEQAVMAKQEAAALWLLGKGANAEYGDGDVKLRIFELALASDLRALVETLLARPWPGGADPRPTLALVSAVTHGDVAWVRALLKLGADPQGIPEAPDAKAWARSRRTVLLVVDADPAAGEAVLDALLAAGAKLDVRGPDGNHALGKAILQGRTGWIPLLRQRGLEPEARLFDNALACAVGSSHWGVPSISGCDGEKARMLLDLGAPFSANATDERGRTLLARAVMSGHEALVLRVLEGRDRVADLPDRQGYTLLHYCARFGTAGMARRLLALGADPNARSHDDRTPLDIASAPLGRADVAEVLQAWASRDAAMP